MPRDSSGNYTLPAGNPVITGTTITSSWGNNTMTDIATVLTASLDRSGNGSMLAALKILDGTVGAPGIAFGAEPSTGFYRVSANTVGLTIGGAQRVNFSTTQFNTTGLSVTLGNPSGGNTLNVSNSGSGFAVSITIPGTGSNFLQASDGTGLFQFQTDASHNYYIGTTTANSLNLFTGNVNRIGISSVGAVAINTPTSGSTLSLGGAQAGTTLIVGIGTVTSGESVLINASASIYGVAIVSASAQLLGIDLVTSGKTYNILIGNSVANALSFADNGTDRIRFMATGEVLICGLSPSFNSNVAFTVRTLVSQTHSTQISDCDGTAPFNAGYLESPVVGTGVNRTCILSDSGKTVNPTTTGTTQTLPSNASVAYPIGTIIAFEYTAAGSATIAINSDTLIWLGTGATGSRTLAQYGKAVVHKIAATTWTISGVNIT